MNSWLERNGLFVKLLASGVGAILAISLLWLRASAYFLEKSRQADSLRGLANTVVIDLLETRAIDKGILLRDLDDDAFYTSQRTEGLRAYHDSMEQARESVTQLMAAPGVEMAVVEHIRALLASYDQDFSTTIGKYRELGFRDWGARGEWNKASQRLEKLVTALGSPALLSDMNTLLRLEHRYLREPGQNVVAMLREVLDRIRARAGALVAGRLSGGRTRTTALPGEGLDGIKEAVDEYATASGKHWAIWQEIGLGEHLGLLGKYREAADTAIPLAAELRDAAIAASVRARVQLTQANLGIAVLSLLLGGTIFLVLSKVISRPLLLATRVAERIAGGDLKVDLGAIHARDVLGTALKTMVLNLTDQVREIQKGANVLGGSTAEISAAVTQVTTSATETATAVTQTMATAEELRQTSELSAQKAGHVSKTAAESTALSAEGQKALAEIVAAMEHIRQQMEAIGASVVALSEQGQVIGEIIDTVDDLAEQSNILSVNASIEAAKAGEQGRGFAVVAQEIKSLAEKSKEGTARVRAILADIQKATAAAVMVAEQGSKAVAKGSDQADAAARSIRALADSIVNVDQAAKQITASSRQQQSGVEQVTAAIENIREATDQNVKSMEQLEATAESLAGIGRNIMDLMAWYKV